MPFIVFAFLFSPSYNTSRNSDPGSDSRALLPPSSPLRTVRVLGRFREKTSALYSFVDSRRTPKKAPLESGARVYNIIRCMSINKVMKGWRNELINDLSQCEIIHYHYYICPSYIMCSACSNRTIHPNISGKPESNDFETWKMPSIRPEYLTFFFSNKPQSFFFQDTMCSLPETFMYRACAYPPVLLSEVKVSSKARSLGKTRCYVRKRHHFLTKISPTDAGVQLGNYCPIFFWYRPRPRHY